MSIVSFWEQVCLHFPSEEILSFSGLGSWPTAVGKEGAEKPMVQPWAISCEAGHTCVPHDLTHPLTHGDIPQDFLSTPAPSQPELPHCRNMFLSLSDSFCSPVPGVPHILLNCRNECEVQGIPQHRQRHPNRHVTYAAGHLTALCGIALIRSCGSLPAAPWHVRTNCRL